MSGPNPLAVSEVLAYTNLMGIASAEQRSKYLRLTQQLDSVYLKHYAETAPKAKA